MSKRTQNIVMGILFFLAIVAMAIAGFKKSQETEADRKKQKESVQELIDAQNRTLDSE
jgi:preprotein translocase subunit SecG